MMKPSQTPGARPDCEALSCLMDGELSAEQSRALLGSLCERAELRTEWVAFHAVGDALRSHEVAAAHSTAFCARVAEAVAREPTVLAPRALAPARSPLRRLLAPGLAVAASAAVIGFVAVPLLRAPPTPAPQVAATAPPAEAPATALAAAALPADDAAARRAAATVANVRAMQAYLAAHRELASGAALPRAMPYLRASAEQPEGR